MDAVRSLKLASICLAVSVVCALVIHLIVGDGANHGPGVLAVFCGFPSEFGWPLASGAGALAGLWSILRGIQSFERSTAVKSVLAACVLVTTANATLLVLAVRWWDWL